jgi:hypothetical protein
VKPYARPQECRDLSGLTSPEQIVDREGLHRCIGGTGLRLNRKEAETQFLEETFVIARADPTELREPRRDLVLLRCVLGSKGFELSVTRHEHELKTVDKTVRRRPCSGGGYQVRDHATFK